MQGKNKVEYDIYIPFQRVCLLSFLYVNITKSTEDKKATQTRRKSFQTAGDTQIPSDVDIPFQSLSLLSFLNSG